MTGATLLTFLLIFSFLIGQFLRRFEAPHLLFSSMIYLLLGVLIGDWGLGLLTGEILSELKPLTSLITGAVGFLLGLRTPRLFQSQGALWAGFITALLLWAYVGAGFFLFSHWNLGELTQNHFVGLQATAFSFLPPQVSPFCLLLGLGLGAVACSTSLLNLGSSFRFQDRGSCEVSLRSVLFYLNPTMQVGSVLFLGLCLATFQSATRGQGLGLSIAHHMGLGILSGILSSLVFAFFMGSFFSRSKSGSVNPFVGEERLILSGLGGVLFSSGLGIVLGISSMFVAFVSGIFLTVFSKQHQKSMEGILVKLEEPLFVLILIVGGASLQPRWEYLIFSLLYILIRWMVLFFFCEKVYFFFTQKKWPRLGQALLGQDLLAVAVTISLSSELPQLSQLFLTTVFGALIAGDFVAYLLLKRVVLDNEPKIQQMVKL